MKSYLTFFAIACISLFMVSCDHVENPYPIGTSNELDTTLYPGNWSNYMANEWPVFSPNTNLLRNVLIEDYTGHKCIFCPAAGDLAHQLEEANPNRVFVASIHAGPQGIGDFQTVSAPEYPLDFTNPQGVEIGIYFGTNDGGFPGNPRGTVNRFNNGTIFQSPTQWTNMTNTMLADNNLKVNMQSALNYYPTTKGAFLHLEIEKLDATLNDALGVVSYLIEDSLVGDQKMSDNSHNTAYTHRDIHRGNLNQLTFGRTLTGTDLINGKYYVNYSFLVPNQLDGNYNAHNMHIISYVYNKVTWEIYQVVKQKIAP